MLLLLLLLLLLLVLLRRGPVCRAIATNTTTARTTTSTTSTTARHRCMLLELYNLDQIADSPLRENVCIDDELVARVSLIVEEERYPEEHLRK